MKTYYEKLKQALVECSEERIQSLFPTIAEGLGMDPKVKGDYAQLIMEAVDRGDIEDREPTSKEITLMLKTSLKESMSQKNLVPLRENITIPASLAIKHPVTEEDQNQIREAVAEYASSTKLNENQIKQLNEAVASYKPKVKWSFPISRCDVVNANRRRYSQAIWEKVLREQKAIYEGAVGLADHPIGDSDPSFKDSAVVWSNLRIDNKTANGMYESTASSPLIWADAIFVGPHGQLAEDILEAGGRVGFSTAAMGELNRVQETSMTGEYQEFDDVVDLYLERPADLVPNPSQDVYGFLEMKVQETESSGDMAAQAPENVISVTEPGSKKEEEGITENKKRNTQKMEEKVATKTKAPSGMSSYEERLYTENVTRYIEKALESTNVKAKLKELHEVEAYIAEVPEGSLLEVKEKLQEAIKATEAEIEKMYVNGEKFQEAFGPDSAVSEVQATLNELSDIKSTLYEASYDWKKVAETLAIKLKTFVEAVDTLKNRPTVEQYNALLEAKEEMESELAEVEEAAEEEKIENKEKLDGIKERIAKYMETSKNKLSQADQEIASLKETIVKLRTSKAKLLEKFEKVAHETMSDETKYLFEGATGVAKTQKERLSSNSKLTETALHSSRERDKREVQGYYDDLLKNHGAALLPHSQYILESKDYQEAVNRFLKISEKINPAYDPSFIMDLDNPTIWEYIQSI